MAVRRACRSGDYRGFDPESREVCVRLFRNKGWGIPGDLQHDDSPEKDVTLWRAVEIFLNYPSVRDCKAKYRYILCLKHIVKFPGKETSIKEIWVPGVRMYQAQRLSEGARPTTVNWENGTPSRLFGVTVETQIVAVNLVRLVKQRSWKGSEREAYISLVDVEAFAGGCPDWFRLII
jgi:hypothetical protein